MIKGFCLLVVIWFAVSNCTTNQIYSNYSKSLNDTIVRIEMNLSAYGVESDDFPSINVYIDFINDSSHCYKSFYNPAYKSSSYSLSKSEIENVLQILTDSDLKNLKKEYKVNKSDQPSSTTTIYTKKQKIVIEDYGLQGDDPLKQLYKIVYKY